MIFGVNFQEHPSRRDTYVFHFKEEVRAQYFRELLDQHHIPFESDTNTEDNEVVWYFGVKKQDFTQARHLNFLVSARFRKPFIPDAGLRYLVIIITLSVIILALIGYFIS